MPLLILKVSECGCSGGGREATDISERNSITNKNDNTNVCKKAVIATIALTMATTITTCLVVCYAASDFFDLGRFKRLATITASNRRLNRQISGDYTIFAHKYNIRVYNCTYVIHTNVLNTAIKLG